MAQSGAVTPALQPAALTAFSVAGASSHPCPTGRHVPLPPPPSAQILTVLQSWDIFHDLEQIQLLPCLPLSILLLQELRPCNAYNLVGMRQFLYSLHWHVSIPGKNWHICDLSALALYLAQFAQHALHFTDRFCMKLAQKHV